MNSQQLAFVLVVYEARLLEPFMKKQTRDRVVPTISAKVSWLILGTVVSDAPLAIIMGEQQENTRESFLARVAMLVH